jgi:endonuclease-3
MSNISKTKKIEMLQKSLHRRYKWQSELPERTVLEHLVYSALLENAPAEIATTAYEILESYFIDWNEVRVTTTQELSEIITILPDPTDAADRVRKALRGVFEKTYMFDLEELRKKGKSLSQAIAFLKSLGTLTRFMADYVTQFALGGHVIPLDESAMRIFRMLDLAQVNKDRTEEYVPGIERAIPKKNGIIFSMELHNFAFLLRTALDTNQDANEYLSVLKNIDPQALNRSYTPPVLVIPKPQPKERTIPSQGGIPFVASVVDDEDFDDEHEDHNGAGVEFLTPKSLDISSDGLVNDNSFGSNKTKPRSKPKKESTREKTTAAPIENKSTASPTQKTLVNSINSENNTNSNTEPTTPESANKVVTNNKATAPVKTSPTSKNTDNLKNNTTPKNTKSTQTTPQKSPIKKQTTKNNKIKDTTKQNPKAVVVNSRKVSSQKNTKPIDNRDKKNNSKHTNKETTSQSKTNKTTNNKKQQLKKTTEKTNDKTNNKIVKIISKESKSVTKQLQKKRPK